MNPTVSSNQPVESGPRGRVGSVPPTIGSLAQRHPNKGSDWLSPAVVVGMLRVSDAFIVLFAAIAAYLTRFHNLDAFGTLELYGGMLALVLTTNILQLAGL
jgi:hypothetical protein